MFEISVWTHRHKSTVTAILCTALSPGKVMTTAFAGKPTQRNWLHLKVRERMDKEQTWSSDFILWLKGTASSHKDVLLMTNHVQRAVISISTVEFSWKMGRVCVVQLQKMQLSGKSQERQAAINNAASTDIDASRKSNTRWESERQLFYNDIVHVQASAYAHWTNFLISTKHLSYLPAHQTKF